MNNTSKTHTWLAGAVAGLAGFISWLATIPPEVQSGWLSELVEITPHSIRLRKRYLKEHERKRAQREAA